MNKSKLFIFLFLFVTTGSLKGQPFEKPSTYEIPQQSVYTELGGNGLVYSLNYDVLFQNGYGVRLGGTYLGSNWIDIGERRGPYRRISSANSFFGLVMGLKMIGEKSSKAELGAGLLFGSVDDSEDWNYIKPPGLTLTAGYRYYPVDSGKFTFKAAFTPVITRQGIYPHFGISFGVTLTPEGKIR